jgi:hypothetical protein
LHGEQHVEREFCHFLLDANGDRLPKRRGTWNLAKDVTLTATHKVMLVTLYGMETVDVCTDKYTNYAYVLPEHGFFPSAPKQPSNLQCI